MKVLIGNGARSIEFSSSLAFAQRELAEEVFVNAPESVVLESCWNFRDLFQELLEKGAGEEVVGLGQDTG